METVDIRRPVDRGRPGDRGHPLKAGDRATVDTHSTETGRRRVDTHYERRALSGEA